MREIVMRKSILLSVIGIICLALGITYGLMTRDKIMVIMSIIIFAVNIYKIFELNKIEKKKEYIVISGKCKEISYKIVGRYQKVGVLVSDSILEIYLPSSIKLKVDEIYDFYFTKGKIDINGCSIWLKSKILSENFIGCELKK